MVFLYVSGGAGNQMSQYAFARRIIMMRGDTDKLIINFEHVEKNGYEDALKYFELYPYDRCNDRFENTYVLIYKICNRIFRNCKKLYSVALLWLRKHGIYAQCDASLVEYVSKAKNIVINGNWENWNYYSDLQEILYKDFRLKSEYNIRNNIFIDEISSNNSICVSIRKYSDEFLSAKRKNIEEKYYRKGIEIILDRVGDPSKQIVFFSNDIAWARDLVKQMDLQCKVLFESGDDSIYEKILAMKNCKHFVMSNSTFSFWTMFLSNSDNKMVVSPFCPKLGFFQFIDAPPGIKSDNWFVLNPNNGEILSDKEG